MENPGTWTLAEHVVNRALNDYYMKHRGDDIPVYGMSIAREITDALRAEGLLND